MMRALPYCCSLGLTEMEGSLALQIDVCFTENSMRRTVKVRILKSFDDLIFSKNAGVGVVPRAKSDDLIENATYHGLK